jgi:hypothetical protein
MFLSGPKFGHTRGEERRIGRARGRSCTSMLCSHDKGWPPSRCAGAIVGVIVRATRQNTLWNDTVHLEQAWRAHGEWCCLGDASDSMYVSRARRPQRAATRGALRSTRAASGEIAQRPA